MIGGWLSSESGNSAIVTSLNLNSILEQYWAQLLMNNNEEVPELAKSMYREELEKSLQESLEKVKQYNKIHDREYKHFVDSSDEPLPNLPAVPEFRKYEANDPRSILAELLYKDNYGNYARQTVIEPGLEPNGREESLGLELPEELGPAELDLLYQNITGLKKLRRLVKEAGNTGTISETTLEELDDILASYDAILEDDEDGSRLNKVMKKIKQKFHSPRYSSHRNLLDASNRFILATAGEMGVSYQHAEEHMKTLENEEETESQAPGIIHTKKPAMSALNNAKYFLLRTRLGQEVVRQVTFQGSISSEVSQAIPSEYLGFVFNLVQLKRMFPLPAATLPQIQGAKRTIATR